MQPLTHLSTPNQYLLSANSMPGPVSQVFKSLRNESGKREKKREKADIHQGSGKWLQNLRLCRRRGCREAGWSPHWDSPLASGTNALHVTTSPGFSFHRTFQCSSGTFLTGNSESFVNWLNLVTWPFLSLLWPFHDLIEFFSGGGTFFWRRI